MHFRKFKDVVMAVARGCGAEVTALHEPKATPNFFAAELCLQHSAQTLYLLCSRDDDTWAISEFLEPNTCELRFVDNPFVSRAVKQVVGAAPLGSHELNGPVSARAHMLDADLKYWKPKTLGQVLFNWWD